MWWRAIVVASIVDFAEKIRPLTAGTEKKFYVTRVKRFLCVGAQNLIFLKKMLVMENAKCKARSALHFVFSLTNIFLKKSLLVE